MEQLFTLRDGRKTACNAYDFFEWLITDLQFFEKETRQRLKNIQLSIKELRLMRATAHVAIREGRMMVARKSGDDLVDEGVKDGDLLGFMLQSRVGNHGGKVRL